MNNLKRRPLGCAMTFGALTVALAMLPAGCADIPDMMPPGGPMPGGVVSFADDVQPIFTAHCAICHSQGGFADLQGIDLRLVNDGRSRDMLVNQPSVQRTDLTLVVPGDAASSLLFLKISSNGPPVGDRMPLRSPPLSTDEIDRIRDWIDQGALDN